MLSRRYVGGNIGKLYGGGGLGEDQATDKQGDDKKGDGNPNDKDTNENIEDTMIKEFKNKLTNINDKYVGLLNFVKNEVLTSPKNNKSIPSILDITNQYLITDFNIGRITHDDLPNLLKNLHTVIGLLIARIIEIYSRTPSMDIIIKYVTDAVKKGYDNDDTI